MKLALRWYIFYIYFSIYIGFPENKKNKHKIHGKYIHRTQIIICIHWPKQKGTFKSSITFWAQEYVGINKIKNNKQIQWSLLNNVPGLSYCLIARSAQATKCQSVLSSQVPECRSALSARVPECLKCASALQVALKYHSSSLQVHKCPSALWVLKCLGALREPSEYTKKLQVGIDINTE